MRWKQGWEVDDSDTEWETFIKESFRTSQSRFLGQFQATVDQDMDMPTLVEHHFHTYDGISGAIGAMPNPNSSDSDSEDGGRPAQETSHSPARPAEGTFAGGSVELPVEGDDTSPGTDEGDRPRTPQSDEEISDDDVPAMEAALLTERELLEESAQTPYTPEQS